MGTIVRMKCSECGYEWQHFEGIGFSGKEIKGDKQNNTTGDADDTIKCPKCGSTKYHKDILKPIALWD